jgi:hypothetical protein
MRTVYAVIVVSIVTVLTIVFPVDAQEKNFFTTSIARIYGVEEEGVDAGDIISYDETLGTYRLAKIGDTVLVGAVVFDSLILVDTGEAGVPVASTGEVMLGVSTLGGSIAVGDLISPSPIPGKGWKARPGDRAIGVAREPFNDTDADLSINYNDIEIGVGRIAVLLDTSGTAFDSTSTTTFTSDIREQRNSVPALFRYIFAFAIAAGSMYLSFKNFGANVRNGILSIGRNPLARTSIQTMVIFNIVLIIIVGGGGVLLGLAILLLPL